MSENSRGEASASDNEAVSVRVALPPDVALHARPAAELVRAAGKLPVAVTVAANGKQANSRSVLQILALGATGGTELTLSTSGPGAAEAVSALAAVVAGLRA